MKAIARKFSLALLLALLLAGGAASAAVKHAGPENYRSVLGTLTAGDSLVLAAGEPGKEILYPVATVILGGLISSTLLDFFVHPALFWSFGRRAAERQNETDAADDLDAPIHEH